MRSRIIAPGLGNVVRSPFSPSAKNQPRATSQGHANSRAASLIQTSLAGICAVRASCVATTISREKEHLQALSLLTLAPEAAAGAVTHVASLDSQQRVEFLELADSHHVVVRALQAIQNLGLAGNGLRQWLAASLVAEQARIENALRHLDRVLRELENAGLAVVVMKSLDHEPDVGNDLDLYTTGDERAVREVFVNRLGARVEARSWGDRIAQKWNFAIPGLRESIEVHAQRLGQMGEHTALARRFVQRRVPKQMCGYTLMVPAPEERVIVATLQRMYRHFYFRVCDIANAAGLAESGELDYAELQRAAESGGIWPGVATFLKIVSDYAQQYRGRALKLPAPVLQAARFGGEKLYVLRRFLRIPIMPEGAELYTKQVADTALRGDVPAALRLSLLPPLAATAAVAFRITGNDKGIW
jgi:acetolactate synthase regulatory subunit